jgi:ribosomal protein S6--L-glutamate ligase
VDQDVTLYFLLARRVPPVPSPVLLDVAEILTRRGFTVDGGIADETVEQVDAVTPAHDLYVLKSHTELSLSLAGALHARGARLLNPYPSCAAVQNKIIAARRLRAAGVPVPRTWVTGDPALLRSIARESPIVVKPYLGHRGIGVHVIRTPADFNRLPTSAGLMVAQEYVESDGEDVKVYVVGDEVFAVRKPFSPESFTLAGRPCAVDAGLCDIAQRVGRALGLGLYGLDVIDGADGPVVVDVNYFPGYKGVPDAAARIASYIERYARGEVVLELPSRPRSGGSPSPGQREPVTSTAA